MPLCMLHVWHKFLCSLPTQNYVRNSIIHNARCKQYRVFIAPRDMFAEIPVEFMDRRKFFSSRWQWYCYKDMSTLTCHTLYVQHVFQRGKISVRRSRIIWRRCDSLQQPLGRYRMFLFRKWIKESTSNHPHCKWRTPIYQNYSMEQVINEVSELNSITITRITFTCTLCCIL